MENTYPDVDSHTPRTYHFKERTRWRWISACQRILRAASIGTWLIMFAAAGAHAQMPGGVPLPNANDKPYQAHGDAQIGYYLTSRSYRYQGQYSLTYNVAQIGPSCLYLMANIDIEILANHVSDFQPDRQTGTFEVGTRRIVKNVPLGLFLRHQSPHNIDRSDRRQGSWEMVGARYNTRCGPALIVVSAGPYIHRIVNDYTWDADAQATVPVGRWLGRNWKFMGDLHGVGEQQRKGFGDYWIELNTNLSSHADGFVGTGEIHHIDVFAGTNDNPIVMGVRLSY